MRKNLESAFGDKTWEDLRKLVTNRARKKFPGVNDADMEECVSSALTDIIDYWMHLPSSLSDNTGRNFAYAMKRATWMTLQFLGQRVERGHHEFFIIDHHADAEGDDDGTEFLALDPAPTPEEAVVAEDERRQLAALWQSVSQQTKEQLNGLLHGVPERVEAATEGVSRGTLHERRARAVGKVRRMAKEAGLV